MAIQGRVQSREYDDRNGTKHEVMQVVAEKVTFLGGTKREEQDSRPAPGQPRDDSRRQSSADDPDVPF